MRTGLPTAQTDRVKRLPLRVSTLLAAAATGIDRTIGWSRLPVPLALPVLIGLRHALRSANLFSVGGSSAAGAPPTARPDAPAAAFTDAHTEGHCPARSLDGSGNDPANSGMGAAGAVFGRNIPLSDAFPEDDRLLRTPNPRVVSARLLARRKFQPATTLNLLAAAWIQFEVHDWFSHRTSGTDPWVLPPPGAVAGEHAGCPMAYTAMSIRRTEAAPPANPADPPVYPNAESHWWDGSQIYGSSREVADALRTGTGGKLRIDADGLAPQDVEQRLDLEGIAANFWVGLALLHSLFMREHNAICDRLTEAYPEMTDQNLYDTARLVNSALMAKIHTIDWTPAIIAHPTTIAAMRGNWFGLLGERIGRRFGRFTSGEVLQGIPGSAPTDHHGVPFSLTEEFVAVYRMHPLIPDSVTVRSLADDTEIGVYELPDLLLGDVRQRLSEASMTDLFYSFGTSHPGALSLHNFPQHLRHLTRHDGDEVDLAAVDILRTRELGVPRYNAFRRHFRLAPVRTFDELTGGDHVLADEIRRVYDDDLERVDLMVGLFAEPKPKGFGFSDTAFRVFVLMASRRLSSDRFFTTDFRSEVYTAVGMAWLRDNSMRSVLLRHFPQLAPALHGVANPFAPWHSPHSSQKGTA